MAAIEDNSALFAIFILTIMALFLVPYTCFRLCQSFTKKKKDIHCQCSQCLRSGKYRKSIFKRISNFLTYGNLTLMLLWFVMAVLVYNIKPISHEIPQFEPFSILGLEPGVSDSTIKRTYRRLSVQYHPDKNRDPEALKYFLEVHRAYKALTDPTSRENFEKYGNPEGRKVFSVGTALPKFLVSFDRESGGVLLLGIVGICILSPLIVAVIYLSRSSKYSGNNVMHQTLSTYFYFMKPSLAPSKIVDIFIKAAEFMEIPVRRSDDEPLHKLFMALRSELNMDLKNIKAEQAKFWKQHPSLIKMELLIQAHLTRESAKLYPALQSDFKLMLELAPRLLEELLKIAVIPRSPHGHGWLRPAVGVLELSQCMTQAVPLNARKAIAGNSEGIAPFLQLPHFTETTVKKIAVKKVRSFQDFRELNAEERREMLTKIAGLSAAESQDVESVLETIPSVAIDITCETEGEEGIQEGDIVTVIAWISLRRINGLIGALPHAPHYPFHKEESFWVLLADHTTNEVWMSQKVSFMDEEAALTTAANTIQETMESLGATTMEINAAVREAVEKVKGGSRLVLSKFQAPGEGNYNLSSHCFSDSWIGCDVKASVKLKVRRAGTRGQAAEEEEVADAGGIGEEEEDEVILEHHDYESEYSDEDGEGKDNREKASRI